MLKSFAKEFGLYCLFVVIITLMEVGVNFFHQDWTVTQCLSVAVASFASLVAVKVWQNTRYLHVMMAAMVYDLNKTPEERAYLKKRFYNE